MKAMGANAVRILLQLGKFMQTAITLDAGDQSQLLKLVDLAEQTKLYLNLTGMGCYHKRDVPVWCGALSEAERRKVQADVANISCNSSRWKRTGVSAQTLPSNGLVRSSTPFAYPMPAI